MKKIIMVGCTIGGMILSAVILMIIAGVGYKELIGITILEVIYLLGFMAVIAIYAFKNISEEKNNEKIPVRVEKEYNDNINYIVKNDDDYGI